MKEKKFKEGKWNFFTVNQAYLKDLLCKTSVLEEVFISGARQGSVRYNICSDGKFRWLENRADMSRADNMRLILFSFIVVYIDNKG